MTHASYDDLAILQSFLARRTPEEQVQLLWTSLATEARRRRTADHDNAVLRNELAAVAAALDETKVARLRAEHDRELLCATIVAQVEAAGTAESDACSDDELAQETPARRIFADRGQALAQMGDLLRRFHLDQYWSEEGLTLDPNHLWRDQALLPMSERVLLLAANDLLSEEPTLAFIDVVEHLRGDVLEAICALFRSADGPGYPLQTRAEPPAFLRGAEVAHHAQ
jgi:hypothetical protein